MRIVIMLACILSLLQTSPVRDGDGWRGIVPLHSTRDDVERILGKPKESKRNHDLYILENEKVSISYAKGNCRGPHPDWNVPEGTVVRLLIIPLKEMTLNDFLIDEEFEKGPVQDDLSMEYINHSKGIKYSIGQFGNVIDIVFMPSNKNEDLRCTKTRY